MIETITLDTRKVYSPVGNRASHRFGAESGTT